MSYIGVPPQATFSSGLLDRFTSTTGTTVTLTHDIASENDIVVFVNFVKQDSTTYSVGGTGNKTLTLGGTLVSSDIVEVHYLNIVGQTNAPSAGSVTTATINDTAVTGAKLNTDVISAQTELATAPAATDELLVSDAGVLKRVDVSLVGGDNTPMVSVRKSSSQSISDNTQTKITFDIEDFDTDSAFASNKFTVPSGEAGKYLINASYYGFGNNNDEKQFEIAIYKNGASVARNNILHEGQGTSNSGATSPQITAILDLSASDYIEIYASIDVNSGTPSVYGSSATDSNYTFLQISKMIG